MTPERSRLRARALELFDELARERGWSDYEISERLGLHRTYVAKTRGEARRGAGPDLQAAVCRALEISPDYWHGTGSYRLYAGRPAADDSQEWSAFVSRHREAVAQIGEEAAGWVRSAPFRGGMKDPAVGWALALDTAARLRRFAFDPNEQPNEQPRPSGVKIMGPKGRT